MLCVRVLQVERFATCADLLRKFGPSNVFPGVAEDVHDGVQEYYCYKNRAGIPYEDLEKQLGGVVGILVDTL